jgi:hypothetical protein
MKECKPYVNLTVELSASGVDLRARISVEGNSLRQAFAEAGIKPSTFGVNIPLPPLGQLLERHKKLSTALSALLFEESLENSPRITSPSLAHCLDVACQVAQKTARCLRIRLKAIPTTAYDQPSYQQLCAAGILKLCPEQLEACQEERIDWLAYLPWEAAMEKADANGISLTRALPQHGYETPSKKRESKGVLDVLLVAASPENLSATGAETSIPAIQSLFAEVGKGVFEVTCLEHARADALASKIKEKEWDIIHILAHGSSSGKGGIEAEDDEGEAERIYGYQFKDLWKSGGNALPQLVFLQVCDSAATFGKLYRGLAQFIHAAGVPYVIGMQAPISEPSAREFSQAFYKKFLTLVASERIDLAIAVARKQARMRQELPKAYIRQHLAENPVLAFCPVDVGLTFGAIPVLYMQDDADGEFELTALPTAIRWPDGKVMLLVKAGQDDQFYIDKYPVTVGQYRRVDRQWKSPFDSPAWLQRINAIGPAGDEIDPGFPATNMSAEQAIAYAEKLGKRLPTDREWLAAYAETYPKNPPGPREYNCADYWDFMRRDLQPTIVSQFESDDNRHRPQDLPGNCNEIVRCGDQLKYIGGSYNNRFDLRPSPYKRPQQDIGFRCVVDPDVYRKRLYQSGNVKPCACNDEERDEA